LPTLRDAANDQINSILDKYPTKRSAVLPLCYLAQEHFGYVSPEAVRQIAEILELDPTEIRGLLGFYTLLHEKPTGKHVIEICTDLPCALRGADQFAEHVCSKLGVGMGGTTDDGLFTVEAVMCVAACDKSPVAQIDLEYFENLDPAKFDALIEQRREEDRRDADTAAGE
jgi:NADH-quinone oxidoreductase subunit E